MEFEYHPDFVEQAVFLATRMDAARECELHQCTDGLYAIGDAETKDHAFREAYAQKFGQWRLGAGIENALLRRPTVARQVTRCVVVPAGRDSQQHIDLLAKPASGTGAVEHTLLVQLKPAMLLDASALDLWLRRELYHVDDMLSERFGYAQEDFAGAKWERNIQRDRYMVAWRTYVAGRLMRDGVRQDREIEALWAAFRRAFRHHGIEPTKPAFAHILNARELTHAQIVQWARNPETLSVGDGVSPLGTARGEEEHAIWGSREKSMV